MYCVCDLLQGLVPSCVPTLRTFVRKSSDIDNFIKLLLLIGNELLVSEVKK